MMIINSLSKLYTLPFVAVETSRTYALKKGKLSMREWGSLLLPRQWCQQPQPSPLPVSTVVQIHGLSTLGRECFKLIKSLSSRVTTSQSPAGEKQSKFSSGSFCSACLIPNDDPPSSSSSRDDKQHNRHNLASLIVTTATLIDKFRIMHSNPSILWLKWASAST
jgi:hypothetical protein